MQLKNKMANNKKCVQIRTVDPKWTAEDINSRGLKIAHCWGATLGVGGVEIGPINPNRLDHYIRFLQRRRIQVPSRKELSNLAELNGLEVVEKRTVYYDGIPESRYDFRKKQY